MASFNKSPTGWRVRVRKHGQVHTGTFPTKSAAQQWATQIEAEILDGKLGKIPNKTVADLLDRYVREITPTKRSARAEGFRLRNTIDETLGGVKLPDLGPEHIAGWRDRRLLKVSAASVLREWNSLSAAFTVAVNEWRWLRAHPMRSVRRPPAPPARQRVISQEEIDAVLHVCGQDYSTAQGRVGLAFLFALETAMRAGEICGLTWGNVFDNHVHLPKTKNGSARDVPLSTRAREITSLLRNAVACDHESLTFNLRPAILDALFRKAKAKAGVEGFTFHDARRTALTRLAKVFPNPLDLARISGHRDLRILMACYYAPRVEDLADRLT